MPRSFLLVLLVGGLLLLPIGCGFLENAGTVTGTVRYKGQALSQGTVSFLSEKGRVATGAIDPSGRYLVPHVSLGSAKVTVQVSSADGPPVSFGGLPKSAQEPGAGVKIPSRYGLTATSGLQHTVSKGKQQWDIDLTE